MGDEEKNKNFSVFFEKKVDFVCGNKILCYLCGGRITEGFTLVLIKFSVF